MSTNVSNLASTNWRDELPVLAARSFTLREPTLQDLGALVSLLSGPDASSFGLESPITDLAVSDFIARAQRARDAGQAFTFVIVSSACQMSPTSGLQLSA